MDGQSLTFVCLANSRKMKGRCIAGKRWKNGAPGDWVRPVSERRTRELWDRDCRLSDYSNLEVLDIVTVRVQGACPAPHQKENHRLMPDCLWQRAGRLCYADLGPLADDPPALWQAEAHSTSGLNNRVPVGQEEGTSLYLIAVDNVMLMVGRKARKYADSKRSVQGLFLYKNIVYQLDVTDPAVEESFLARPDGRYSIDRPVLCISLSDEHQGYYYKLIASMIVEDPSML